MRALVVFVLLERLLQTSYPVTEVRCRAVRFAVVASLPNRALAHNRCSLNLCLMNHADRIVLCRNI